MRVLALAMLMFSSGCVAAAAGTVATAAINTAVGVGVSGVRRANGECFTPCNPGTACNPTTGMCDPLPCGGRCAFDEKCEQTYTGEKCVSSKPVPMPSP
jgi:hypothetical protein